MAILYPEILTDKAWQKAKGVVAKTKSTGVGKTLIALQKAYQATEFAKMGPIDLAKETTDPMSYAKRRTSFEAAVGSETKKLAPLIAQSAAAVKSAKATFAKERKLLAYLTEMEAALAQFKTDFAPGGRQTAQFLQSADREFKYLFGKTRTGTFLGAGAYARTEKARQQLLKTIKDVEKSAKISAIHDAWGSDGPHRVLTTGCELWDNFFAKDAPQLAKSIYAGKAKQEYGHLPWVWEVANEMNSDATNAVTALATRSSEDRAVATMTLQYSRSIIEFKKFTDFMGAFDQAARQWL
jgi:hypothetical protein